MMDHSAIASHLQDIHTKVVDSCVGRLQEIVRDHTFIAGGAIASLLHNDKVHDYDMYFTNEAAAMEAFWIVYNKNDQRTNDDYTVYHKMPYAGRSQFALSFTLIDGNQRHKIQFIHRYAGLPTMVVYKFDFEHCMSYYDPKTNELTLLNNGWALRSKYLVYNDSCAFPVAAVQRAIKYIERGYKIENNDLRRMIETVVEMQMKNPQSITDQLAGMY